MHAHERAAQVWSVLALAARNRQILTYDLLSQLVGVPARGFAHILDHVQRYCIQQRLPPLTILVVNGRTGRPGKGFFAARDTAKHQVRVFNHDWLEHGAPSPDDLAAAIQAACGRARRRG